MPIISKNDSLAWGAYLFLGAVAFVFLYAVSYGIFQPQYSVYLKSALAFAFSLGVLYLYKKYLALYLDAARGFSIFANIRKLGIGWAVNTAFFSAVVLILYLGNHYKVERIAFALPDMLLGFSLFFLVAVCEEVVFRGILFRLMADKWNMPIALIVSSVLFGLMHYPNEGATLWSAILLGLTLGWLSAIAYAYHKTLWVPIAMHWAWNFIQGSVFGCPISGDMSYGTPLITSTITGPTLVTGGTFGPESSIITLTLGFAIPAVYTAMYYRKKARHEMAQEMGI